MSSDTGWISLKSIPAKHWELPRLINTNDGQYIIMPTVVIDSCYIKYDTLKDEFSDPIQITNDLKNGDQIKCAYNDKHGMLCMYNKDESKLRVIDINTNKSQYVPDGIFVGNPRMISIGDTVHLISNVLPGHYVFNIKSSELIHYAQHQTKMHWVDQAIVLKSEKSILGIG